jgi:hypothetical protein
MVGSYRSRTVGSYRSQRHGSLNYQGRRCAAFERPLPEVVVPGFKRRDFLGRGALEIHREPDRPDEQPGHAGGDVLRGLAALLAAKLADLARVGGDFAWSAAQAMVLS